MSEKISIKYIEWRHGRPRFKPGPGLRKLGYRPQDLRHDDGRWYSQGEALDWSNRFTVSREASAATAKAGESLPPGIVKPKGSYPVSQLAEDWLKNPRLNKRRGLSPATMRDYRQKIHVLEKFDPDLWASEVASLDYPTCFGLYEELLEAKGVATARGTMGALGRAIKWAMQRGKVRIPVNPARDLDMLSCDPRARFITPAEFETLVWAAEKKLERPDIADMLHCGVWTGQRQADRLALLTSAIRNGRFILRQGKTAAIVNPPIAKPYHDRILAGYRRRRRHDVESEFVHLNESTWEPWNASTYRHLFAELREEASKKMPSCETIMEKDLRATAVTWMALSPGTELHHICAVSGHSLKTATEILRHYLAIHPDMATTAIGNMVSWYDSGAPIDLAV